MYYTLVSKMKMKPVINFLSFVSFFDQVKVVEKDPTNRPKMDGHNSVFAILEKKLN